MKVVVSSTGDNPDAAVDPRFGRARWFIVVDTDTMEFTPVENRQNLDKPQGAGIQAGTTVVETGAEALLTGHCGPKAYMVLDSAGVKVYTDVTGTVRQAVDRFVQGNMVPARGADVDGHWM
ncbi:MAG: NifB/NifX family molybdenum-iron cluster-binding protein [Desulfatibacillaceae bacterium]